MEVSAGFIIFRHGKFLFLVHREGHLDFPKGHVEEGEGLLEAAFRELEEEAGLRKEDVHLFPGFRCEMRYEYSGKKKRVVLFLAEMTGGEARHSWEHSGLVWIEAEKAEKALKYEGQRKCIRNAIDFLRSIGKV